MSRTPKRRLTPTKTPTETPTIESKVQTFARILQAEMLKRGYSQSDMARLCWGEEKTDSRGFRAAVGRDKISSYVNAKAIPEPQTLKLLADRLGMTVEDLAPDIATQAIEKDNPSLMLHVIAGHEQQALLKINRIVRLATAVKVIELIEADGR